MKQLILIKLVLPSDIRQGVEGLRGTAHTEQAQIHESLQELRITIQEILDGYVRR